MSVNVFHLRSIYFYKKYFIYSIIYMKNLTKNKRKITFIYYYDIINYFLIINYINDIKIFYLYKLHQQIKSFYEKYFSTK